MISYKIPQDDDMGGGLALCFDMAETTRQRTDFKKGILPPSVTGADNIKKYSALMNMEGGVVEKTGHDCDERWYGMARDQIWDVIEKGDPSQIKCIAGIAGKIFQRRLPGILRRRCWDTQGNEPDILQAYNGRLDFWRSAKRERSVIGGKTDVSIWIDVCGNANRSSADLSWRAKCALALAYLFDEAGYTVAINAIEMSIAPWQSLPAGIPKNRMAVIYRLKYAGDPLSIRALAMTTYGFFLRVIGFANMHRCGVKACDDYGRAYTPDDMPEWLKEPGETSVWIGGDIWSEEACMDKIKQEVGAVCGDAVCV